MRLLSIPVMDVATEGNQGCQAGDIVITCPESPHRIAWLESKGVSANMVTAYNDETKMVAFTYQSEVSDELWTEYRLKWG